jgi:(p)ppGpp synthase/HD superfamily hydrolase
VVDGKTLDMKEKEDVLVQIGNLSRKPGSLLKSLNDVTIKSHFSEKIVESKTQIRKRAPKPISEEIESVIIGRERDIPYKFAHCCEPKSGDKLL